MRSSRTSTTASACSLACRVSWRGWPTARAGEAALCAWASPPRRVPRFCWRVRAPRRIAGTTQLPRLWHPSRSTLVDLDDATRATLREAGITTFGQAAALPRDGLARRFGAALVTTLDRALGRTPDPRASFVPPPRFTSRLELPAPVHDVEALGFGVQRLVQELAPWLTARGLGVVRLSLALAHERYVRQRGIPETVVPFALGAPARMPAHLLGVLRERLARVALPAAVEAITLASDETAPLAGRNLGLLPGDDAHAVEIPLLDRLRARLGEEALTRPRPASRASARARDARCGNRSGGRCLWARRKPCGKLQSGQSPTHKEAAAPNLRMHHLCPTHRRPIWLLAEPQPLAHLLEMQPWVLRDGPERIESGWWDGADVRRDYFIATYAGGRNRVDLPRPPLRDRRRRVVPARAVRMRVRRVHRAESVFSASTRTAIRLRPSSGATRVWRAPDLSPALNNATPRCRRIPLLPGARLAKQSARCCKSRRRNAVLRVWQGGMRRRGRPI